MERTITIQQIKDVAQEAYNLYKDNTDGKNADYTVSYTHLLQQVLQQPHQPALLLSVYVAGN